ncbi:MAG: PAS domain-containing protein [Myxococcales bacterium]|nr:PAS domain-containing protein [Myxococcales bacterium]
MGAEKAEVVPLAGRQQARKLLSETDLEEFLTTLDREVREAIVITDTNVDDGPHILHVNAAFTKMTEYAPADILGRALDVLHRQKKDSSFGTYLRTQLAAGHIFEGEGNCYRKDGTEVLNNWHILPLNKEGEPVRFVVFLKDLTVVRQLEAVVEARNFWDVSKTITAGLRHELVNPLNSTKTAVEVLLRSYQSFDAEKVKFYLQQISGELGRMEYILRAVDTRGTIKVETEEFGVRRFLTLFAKMVGRQYPLTLRTLPPENVVVRADLRGVHQVLLNLVTNAWEAMTTHREPIIAIETDYGEEQVEIRLTDNGQGIPENYLEHIFEPFWTSKSNGTGIGLSIAKRMMERMGGSMRISSISGVGTTVCLLLPRAIS